MLEAAGSKAELVTLGGIEGGVNDLGDGQLLVVGDGDLDTCTSSQCMEHGRCSRAYLAMNNI